MTKLDNWKIQLRKGYLELCLLLLIKKHRKIYGFDLLEKLAEIQLPVKEGTLYPMLNRMSAEHILTTCWETENIKGHPRKFYSLTEKGNDLLTEMRLEFKKILTIFEQLDINEVDNED
jgi:PadR family transcriptional regulator, regulatory protein PadR